MRLFNFLKKRSTYPFTSPDDEDFAAALRNSFSGVRVTADTSVRLGAVYACVRVISETLAAVPLLTYEERENKKLVNKKDPLYKLLHYRPNPWMSAYDFFRLQMTFVLLRGNAYSEIISKRGEPSMLVPLHPERVTVELDPKSGQKSYTFRTHSGDPRVIPGDRMLHFKGLSLDGLTGVGVIDYIAKEAVGLGLAQEQYGARAFGQRANISGILHHPGKLDDEAHKRISDSWNKTYGGVQNSHKVAITEEGMKFEPVSMTNEAAQFIEARRYQVEEICRIFRVPLHKVMDMSKAHYNNIEHTSTEFYTDTIVPWAICIEKEIDWILIGEDELDRRYVRFNISALLRGDTKTRAEVQNIRLSNGMQSINEAREEEDWNPIGAEGDVHRIPLNTGNAAGDAGEHPDEAEDMGEKHESGAPMDRTALIKDMERLKYAYLRTFEDAISLVCRREANELRSEKRKKTTRTAEAITKLAGEWSETYSKLVAERVRGVVFSWVESVIFCEKAGLRGDLTPRNLDQSAALVDSLTQKWAAAYAMDSGKIVSDLLSAAKIGAFEEIAEDLERNRARREAERWVSEIQNEVELALYGPIVSPAQTPVPVAVTVEHKQEKVVIKRDIEFGTNKAGNKTASITEEVLR